jgi:hypothetical protein
MKLAMQAQVKGVQVDVSLDIDTSIATMEGLPSSVSDEAMGRMQMVLRREMQRCAEIAYVDLLTQRQNEEERIRLRALPKDRPAIIVAAGTKELVKDGQPTVHVLRGEFEVGREKKRMAAAPKGGK